MPIHPADFEDFAGSLLNPSPSTSPLSEICARCIASKAYYSAFHGALEFLRDSIKISERTSHWVVRETYRHCTQHQNFVEIGQKLGDLVLSRERADYRLNDNFDRKVAEDALKECQKIRRILDNLQPQKFTEELKEASERAKTFVADKRKR